jgi:predicted secreted protein
MADPAVSTENVTVTRGSEFTIGLRAVPTAGYSWRLDATPDAIKPLGTDTQSQAAPGQAGGMATQVFHFQAIERGQFVLRFALKRPWEAQPTEIHTVNLTVE